MQFPLPALAGKTNIGELRWKVESNSPKREAHL
jgi:hypothetical protein